MTKHARFLHIEQRRDEEGPESEAADRGRIAAVLGASPISRAPSDATIELDPEARAGDGSTCVAPTVAELAPGEATDASEISLDLAGIEGQPFVRCTRCGADSTIHAAACGNCAAPLDTAEQRAFNERLWDEQRRELERERAALAELASAREEQKRAAARPLPEPGMSPPPELLEPIGSEDGPFFFEALRALREPRWRWIAGGLVVGLPLLLVVLGGAILAKIGWGLLVLLVLSMFPRRVATRLLERWTGRG